MRTASRARVARERVALSRAAQPRVAQPRVASSRLVVARLALARLALARLALALPALPLLALPLLALPLLALPLLAACESSPPQCTPRTDYTATGFFHVEEDCAAPLLVDPTGRPFFSFGVNHVSWDGDTARDTGVAAYHDAVVARYGTEDAWAAATAQRLGSWGWNTAGAWSSDSVGRSMPYTPILGLSGGDWSSGTIPDYFDPAWADDVNAKAAAGTAGRSDDANLVGYFIDNEMHWGPDWRTANDLLDDFMALGADAPGKQALVALLRDAHAGDVAAFNAAWGTAFATFDELAAATKLPSRGASAAADADRSAFVALAAQRFFTVTAGAIRAGDPNHLVLGVRFVAAFVPREVAAAAGASCDVVSVNDYEFIVDLQAMYPPAEYNLVDLATTQPLADLYQAAGKPILVSEFGYRAADSGLPNSWPPIYPTLNTQTERAASFEAFAESLLAAPWLVGYHWFEWADEPATGRFDGEDCNWGLVNAADDPYAVITARSQAVNQWTPP